MAALNLSYLFPFLDFGLAWAVYYAYSQNKSNNKELYTNINSYLSSQMKKILIIGLMSIFPIAIINDNTRFFTYFFLLSILNLPGFISLAYLRAKNNLAYLIFYNLSWILSLFTLLAYEYFDLYITKTLIYLPLLFSIFINLSIYAYYYKSDLSPKILFFRNRKRMYPSDKKLIISFRNSAKKAMLLQLTLGLSQYIDRVVVFFFATEIVASRYFVFTQISNYALIFLVTFGTSLVGSLLKNSRTISESEAILRNILWASLLMGVLYFVFLKSIVEFLWKNMYVSFLNLILVSGFVLVSGIRIYLQSKALYKNQISKITASQLLTVLCYLCFIYIFREHVSVNSLLGLLIIVNLIGNIFLKFV